MTRVSSPACRPTNAKPDSRHKTITRMQPDAAMLAPGRLSAGRCRHALMEDNDVSSEFRPQPQSDVAQPRYRHVSIGHSAVDVSERHGILHMRSLAPLAPLPARLLDRLVHWAKVRPQQTFIAAREQGGDWRRVSYARCSTAFVLSPKACSATGFRPSDRWRSFRATTSNICRLPWARCMRGFPIARFLRPIRCCPRISPSCGMFAICCSRAGICQRHGRLPAGDRCGVTSRDAIGCRARTSARASPGDLR